MTEAAKAQGWCIDVSTAEIKTNPSGTLIPFSTITDGIQFKMPTEEVEFSLDIYQDVSMKPVKLAGILKNGALKFSTDTAGNNVAMEALPGTTIYVHAIPDPGYKLKDDLVRIIKYSDKTIVSEEVSTGLWKFVTPEGGIWIQNAEFEPIDNYEITFAITSGKQVQVSADGGASKGVVDGDKMIAKYGTTIVVTANSGEKILSMTASTGSCSGNSYTVPVLPGTPGAATLTIAVG